MIAEDFDLDAEIALLENQGASSDKYYNHSTAHTMAFTKYVVAAKQAREGGNAARAKQLRAIGKKHKAAAEALASIANHHVDATFARQQLVRKAMPAKLQEARSDLDHDDAVNTLEQHGWEFGNGGSGHSSYHHSDHPGHTFHVSQGEGWQHTKEDGDEHVSSGTSHKSFARHLAKFHGLKEETKMNDLTAFIEENEDDVVIEDVEVTDDEAITELVRYAIEGKPVSFRKVVNELLVARAGFVLEVLQEAIAADADGSDEDAEDKDNDESPELTEISKGLAGRYVKKASRDMADASATAVEADHQGDGDAAEANDRRWEKRDQGISRAVKRLTKESVSPVGKVTRADKGANVAVGNQGPRTIKKAAFSKKKPEQKSVSVAAGDTVRSQEAAD